MKNFIFLSIHEEHVKNIVSGLKNYEFRNFIPKKTFNSVIVYTTSPVKEIRYIIKVGEIVNYPEKITEDGIGNKEFNNGDFYKHAYAIKEVQEISPIKLKELKEKYSFIPPQAFSYGDKYPELCDCIIKRMED